MKSASLAGALVLLLIGCEGSNEVSVEVINVGSEQIDQVQIIVSGTHQSIGTLSPSESFHFNFVPASESGYTVSWVDSNGKASNEVVGYATRGLNSRDKLEIGDNGVSFTPQRK